MILRVTETEDTDDGGAIVHMEIDDEFKEYFCKLVGIDDFDHDKFTKWMNAIIRGHTHDDDSK